MTERQKPLTIFVLKKGRKTWNIPRDALEMVLDKICHNAWMAANYKVPSSFDFYDEIIEIPVSEFKWPLTDNLEEIFAHLKFYGVLTEYNRDLKAAKCDTIDFNPRKFMTSGERTLKPSNVPLFRYVYQKNEPPKRDYTLTKERAKETRPRAKGGGRKPADETRVQVTTSLRRETLDRLKENAAADGVSVSAKIAEILKNWARRNPVKE